MRNIPSYHYADEKSCKKIDYRRIARMMFLKRHRKMGSSESGEVKEENSCSKIREGKAG